MAAHYLYDDGTAQVDERGEDEQASHRRRELNNHPEEDECNGEDEDDPNGNP
jgi:hypothetical protein